tara:strand:- start:1544 stop:2257 length:714 start_codon:yes stop_codon:yes gene_type:complete
MKSEIIVEIGQNHDGYISKAKELIYAAKENGGDVAKFQLFNAKKLFKRKNNKWFDYNCKCELSLKQLYEIKETCDKVKIEFMASVFDLERFNWLKKINVKRFKIASRSIEDTNLISNVINENKPVIVSLGFWKKEKLPNFQPCKKIFYLFCISDYPTAIKKINFNTIDFKKYNGFSDHTVGVEASMIALSRGASIIEKHFTIDKKSYGPDHNCSMTPDELKLLANYKKITDITLKKI